MDYYQKLEKIKTLIEKNQSPYLTYISIKAVIINNPKAEKVSRYTLDDIARQVNELCGLTLEEINQRTRQEEIVLIRQMAHYKATKFTFEQHDKIGKYFGNLDRITVRHSKRKIQNLLETDKRFREQYETFLNN